MKGNSPAAVSFTKAISLIPRDRRRGAVGEMCIRDSGVTVTQQANANPPEMAISVNPSSLTFEGEGAAPQEVTVTSSSETLTWTAAPDETSGEWITVAAAGDKLTVSVADNPDTQRRSGTVVITRCV